MFRLEQKEYAKEKIDWALIDYQDNQPVIDLIASKPAGVLHILDDECNFPQVSTKGGTGRNTSKKISPHENSAFKNFIHTCLMLYSENISYILCKILFNTKYHHNTTCYCTNRHAKTYYISSDATVCTLPPSEIRTILECKIHP